MSKNDETILKLKKQIEEKKALLKSTEKFSPVTNCSLDFRGVRYNFHAMGTDNIKLLMTELKSIEMAQKELGFEKVHISGFTVDAWLSDLKQKMDISKRKEEEANLASLEKRLTQLLSTDKQVELEIEDISKLISG